MNKPKNPDITSSVPSGIVAQKPATPAQRNVAPLKAPTTEAKFKSEQDPAFQAMLAKISPVDQELAKNLERMRLLEILQDNAGEVSNEPLITWAKENGAVLGKDFDAKDPIDVAYGQFRRQNPTDRETTAEFEATTYIPMIVNPRIPSQASRDRNVPGAVIDDGFKAPTFRLNKDQARTELARDIRTVSEMYAADAGMSAQDFAKVMGGIAVIESRFGVLRSVSGTKYASSAGGAFHYLDGTVAGEVRQSMSDPRVSARVLALGVSVGDGVSRSEAWTLKEDNILAGSLLARRVVETVRRNPELRNDIEALTTRVYQTHNLGDAGARALAQGGREALERIAPKSDDNNPMFFRGTTSDAEVNSRYRKFVSGAVASANPLIEASFTNPTQTVLVARRNTPSGLLHPEPA